MRLLRDSDVIAVGLVRDCYGAAMRLLRGSYVIYMGQLCDYCGTIRTAMRLIWDPCYVVAVR